MINTNEIAALLPTRKATSLNTRKDNHAHIQLQPITSNLIQQQTVIPPYTISTKFNIRKKYHTEPKKRNK
jgi:hypothetical protein